MSNFDEDVGQPPPHRQIRSYPKQEEIPEGGKGVVERESWAVIDQWWTEQPTRRHFFVLEMPDGVMLTLRRDEFGVWSVVDQVRPEEAEDPDEDAE